MPRLPIRTHFQSFLSGRLLWALAIIVFVAGLTACKPAASGLDVGFLNPPDSAKPRVYWWWLFNRVDKAAITRDLEEFKAKGISGVNLICTGGYAGLAPLPGVKFLGPEWRELFRHAVKEAARLKIEMGFNLAGGWVMIGPWVTQDNAMKKVTQSELKVRGPGKFRGALPAPPAVDGYYKDVWVQAFPEEPDKAVDPRTIVDVTDLLSADGRFDWDVPAGAWIILRTGYTLTGSRWDPYPKGDTFAEGAGYQIDYLNPAARLSRKRVLLDLGAVKAVAEVRLNGRSLGVLWTAPWRVDITNAVRPAGNALEIDVVNLWANRVIGDLNLPKEKRVAVTHDAFRFDMITKTTSLLDSGLLGPVSILRVAGENETF